MLYSRSTSKKSIKGQTKDISERSVGVRESAEGDDLPSAKESADGGERKVNALPFPPPNYRGMIYDRESAFFEHSDAEGIERLVKNDESYCIEKMRKIPKKLDRKPFSHLDPPACRREKSEGENGLKKLVSGLHEKDFQPEDILICAMIMLMLNSKSEDDILMVLVLMLLL